VLGKSSLAAALPPRRQVSIRRDDADFVVAFEPDGVVVFRHEDAGALRKVCNSLRWKIIRDTVDLSEFASWPN